MTFDMDSDAAFALGRSHPLSRDAAPVAGELREALREALDWIDSGDFSEAMPPIQKRARWEVALATSGESREPQDFIPGYRIRYIELENACVFLKANGWAGGIGFDEAVKALTPSHGNSLDTEER